MNREELFYLAPYIFSLLLSLGIFLYTWRHRHVRGARTYAWFAIGQVLTILGFILELISPTLAIKIFWDKFQWLTLSYLTILPVLRFSIQYSEYRLRQPVFFWGPVLIFLAIFTALLLTDDIHHLFYPNPHLSSDYPFPELQYDFTYVIYIYVLVFLYGANLYGISLLINRAIQPHNPHRPQYWIIVAGLLTPLLFSFFTLTDLQITPQRDSTPFALAIGNLIVAWGLFRYGLFDIAPIARGQIVENMKDPVVVLDPTNRVVDINKAALTLIGKSSSEMIGRSSTEAFAKWPFLVSLLSDPAEQRREVSVTSADKPRFFDISISQIFDRRELIGRIVVARDITETKSLQIRYQALSEALEQRVRERTEELHNSAERYRAVVENQTEFIVRWKPDGTRTFVNEAYCRYWDISYEQALAINFLFHIAEEDRPAVEEKIARLHSGVADAETEIHRVIRPDGKIAWQEWTDQAIRDDWGHLIEIQSVGRDITEQKEAEADLRESEARFAILSTATFEAIGLSEAGKIIDVNEQMLTMFGYTRDEMIGMSVEQFVAPESRDVVKRHKDLEEAYEHLAVKKDGTIFPVEIRPRMIPYRGRSIRVSAIRDMTERKKAEEAILDQLAFDEMMTSILSRFATCPYDEVDTSIETSLKEIAEFIGVDHAYLVIFSVEKVTYNLTHEWCASHVLPIKGSVQNIVLGTRSWMENELLSGRVVKINTAEDYPLEAATDRQISQTEGAQSVLNIPVSGAEGQVSGCIGLHSHARAFLWSQNHLSRLKMVGNAIVNTLERKRAEENLAEAYETTLEGWAKALELRDKETEGHSRRVTETTLIVARAMGFGEEEIIHIRRGALLHDIGKMGIPDEILRKNGALTAAERIIVEKHPDTALALLKGIPFLEKALEIPCYHHEKWDGSGYPCGLKGTEIPLAARIFAVADVWDALSTDRPYREAWPREKVTQYLIDESGKHFDPKVVELFLQLLQEGKI